MSYTKKDIAMTVLKEVSDISDDTALDIRQIMLHIDVISDKLRTEYLSALINANRNDVSQFLVEYPNDYDTKEYPIIRDTFTNRYIAFMPCTVLPLPYQKGVWKIAPINAMNDNFIVRRNNTSSFTNGLKVNDLEGKKQCEIAGTKLYIKEFNGIENVKLYMALIPSSAYINENMPYPVPNDFISDIIAYCKSQLIQQAPKDILNDGK